MNKKIFLIFSIFILNLSAETIWVDCNSQKDKQTGTKEYPFIKISDAIKVSKEGDEIVINQGNYRETIQGKSGIKIKGIGRVVINGGKEIKTWEKYEKNIWRTYLDKEIDELFLKNKRLEIARYPEKKWLKVEKFEEKEDTYKVYNSELKNLKDMKSFEVRILNSIVNGFFTCPVINYNPEDGFVEFKKQNYLKITEKDIFYLQHNKNFIKIPGQWAIEKEGEKYAVYFWPEKEDDLKFVETTGSDRVINIGNVKNFEIEGIEVCGGETYGIYISNCENIKIKNCIVYNNKHLGISVNGSKNVSILKNIVLFNGNGVAIGRSQNIEVINNEIGFNNIDGLIVSWNSQDVVVKGNYIHHHILYGHPDNIQTYRNVKNLKIEDNLLLCGGQSIMMEETYNLELKNNIIIGAGAYSVIFGHQNTDNVKMHFNTVVLSQYGSVNFTGKQYDVKGNVFITGHPGAIYGINVNEYEGDYNVFWNCEISNPTTIAASGKWYKASQFEEYKKNTQKDINSLYSNPLFKNFPVSFHVVNPLNSDEENLQINLPDLIKLNDFVEINFDGIPRKVIEKKENKIKIFPKLENTPFRIVLLCNWGQFENFELDFGVKEESPVRKVIYENQTPGAKINYRNMKNCDFDNDGKRDLMALPDDLKKVYEEKLKKTFTGGEIEKKWR
ncbi:MAG: right-handed parallel beta-helix repeat-containing protein [bacterium]|nr:right-handed parallel beta-helix repeat-containing protein [bacterium]MDW8163267.1 right-handed parallel beta-helix repeat-containing protein [Candidatus Omnitrophota bacterium]